MGLDKNNHLVSKVKNLMDSLFKSTRIFSVGDSLGYITNIEGNGNYMLGIYNNDLKSKPFKLKCHVGEITSIKELHTVRDLTREPGYFPDGYENTKPGLSDKNHIAAGDVRLFLINVNENNVEYLPKIHPEKREINRYISVPSLIGLQDRLQTMPTFFDYLSGIKVNWKDVLDIDRMKFAEDAWWYNLKQLQIAVEFDSNFIKQYKNNSNILSDMAKTFSTSKYVTLLLYPDDFPEKLKNEINRNFPNAFCAARNSGKIVIVNKGEVTFPRYNAKPVVIDEKYILWDNIYKVASAVNKGGKFIVPPGDYNKRDSISFVHNMKPKNERFYFSLHGADKDIAQVLREDPRYLEEFGGVKIDGTYLFSRSMEKCKKEAALLQESGIDIIVDLCREINNYPNLTWLSEIRHSYKRSMDIYDNIYRKWN